MRTSDAARPVDDTAAAAPAAEPASGYGRLAVFLGPLIFTGLMMTTDTPIVNAALARLPDARTALAAFTVAYSLALVYEAPHVMMIEAGTTLATTRQALALLRRFYLGMAAIVGLVGAGVVLTPIYDALVGGLMAIPPEVAAAARPGLAVLLLWPLPIGWRRLHQGALIRHGESRAVGAGALPRIGVLVGATLLLLATVGGSLPGTALGALAMLASVTAEAIYAHWAAERLLADLPAGAPDGRDLSLRDLWTFYWPLAGTSILSTVNRPVLSAGLAIAATAAGGGGADTALAAWGVAWGMLFLLNGATLTLAASGHRLGCARRRGGAAPGRPADRGRGGGVVGAGGAGRRHAGRGGHPRCGVRGGAGCARRRRWACWGCWCRCRCSSRRGACCAAS